MNNEGISPDGGTVESYLSGLSSAASSAPPPTLSSGGVIDSGHGVVGDASVQRAIAAAMSFDMTPVLSRYAQEYGLSDEEAREHEVEIKRFLVLCAHSPTPYAIMPPLDYLWHTFIVFTRMYTDFCTQVAGRYLHHTPTSVGGRSPEEQLKSYESLLLRYVEVFITEPPQHIWPRISAMTGGSECDFHPPCS